MRTPRIIISTAIALAVAFAGSAASRADHLHKATILDGLQVQNDRGENLGRVFDLVIDKNDGRVAYAAVEVGEKCFAIPLRAMRISSSPSKPQSRVFLINADKTTFERLSGFKKDQEWPSVPDADVAKGIHFDLGRVRLDIALNNKPESNHHLRRATSLIGFPVKNSKAESLGTVRDFMIDVNTEQVAYVAFGHGGVLGVGEKLFAMDWNAAEIKSLTGTADECFLLNMEKSALDKHPGFDKDHWPSEPDRQLFLSGSQRKA